MELMPLDLPNKADSLETLESVTLLPRPLEWEPELTASTWATRTTSRSVVMMESVTRKRPAQDQLLDQPPDPIQPLDQLPDLIHPLDQLPDPIHPLDLDLPQHQSLLHPPAREVDLAILTSR